MKPLLLSTAALRRCLLPALLLGAASAASAQALSNVGVGTTAPDASAMLDVSSTTQGLLLPRLTAAQRNAIASPATGLLLYQTDGSAGFYFYDGNVWAALGSAGSPGPAGAAGLNALVRTTAEAAGTNCATGGTKVESGQDTNNNGSLDAAEVTTTRYVCNGAAGAPGSAGSAGAAGAAGLNALVRTTAEAAGANCATGGTKVESGQDTNNNGSLDAAEITATRYVCNGAAGTTGAKGDKGDTGTAGTAGSIGTKGDKGDAGTAGTAGSTGAKGDTGVGVPTGGTAGQILTKVNATDYNTQWSSPSAGAASSVSVQLRANKVGGSGETLPAATSTTAPTITFNNVLTTPTLGTWDGTTYTVGTSGAGLYLVQANILTPDAATPTQTVSANLVLEVNNAGYGSNAGNVYYGLYTSLNVFTPAGTKGRGEFSRAVYLNAGDSFKIRGTSSTGSLATQPISTVAASYLAVLKLN
ncbi:collagen-like protein [Hymenobacter sp. ASUV-10]|uniref:Collagen-like protein n=1 Tax=Hymenobacter aranciens TaxID=3063996 RepID=A0ABT9BJG5_9BACT|nr:collagen-like protein [Hymenobacter sp. ASUV-10]MDO7876791.1 collagen-like protein [Hymenobacter sp. ASUV-10]